MCDKFRFEELDTEILYQLVDESSNAVIIRDLETYELLYTNQRAEKLPGVTKWTAGDRCHHFMMHKDAPCSICPKEKLSFDKYYENEFHSENTGRHYLLRGRLANWKGRVVHIEYLIDETEQYRDKEQLKNLTDNIPGGVGIYNVFPNGKIEQVYLNEGYYKLIGKKNEKQNASHDFSMLGIVHKDDKKRFIDATIVAVRTDGSVNEDIRILCSGGIYKWFNMKANIAEKTDKMCTMYIASEDGKSVYASKTFAYKAEKGLDTLSAVFAMKKGITDKNAVFTLSFENGKTAVVDNVSVMKLTENNVDIDYSKVDLTPVPENSGNWTGVDVSTGELSINGADGMVIEAVNASINYQRMLLHAVNLTKGVTYTLKFKAKSDKAEAYALSIQEDNSWATTFETGFTTTNEWQEYEYQFVSTLTNAGNPINLKYLLSGPDVTNGNFYLKDVTLNAVVVEAGADVPEGTATLVKNTITAGKDDVVINLANGEWADKFAAAAKGDGKAVVMVGGVIVDDFSIDYQNDKIVLTIDKKYFGKTNTTYDIELALEDYNNLALSVKTKNNPSATNSTTTGSKKKKNNVAVTTIADNDTAKSDDLPATPVGENTDEKEAVTQGAETDKDAATIDDGETAKAAAPKTNGWLFGGIAGAVLLLGAGACAVVMLKKREQGDNAE